jgi:hypothetical protein
MSFNDLGLSPTLLQAVHDTGYTTPTPIQLLAIPAILTGKDVMGAAQTGTGKTAGFTLPLLQLLSGGQPAASNQVRALVLTPTRELAAQVQESIETYGKHEKLRSAVVFGGVTINPQQMALRNQPLNEISAGLSGSQVQMPQFQGYTGSTVAPTPDLQAMQAQDAAATQRYGIAANQAASNASGLYSLAGAAIMASDRRLKSNIVRIGTHPRGIGVYEYDIRGERQRVVMAAEV